MPQLHIGVTAKLKEKDFLSKLTRAAKNGLLA